MRSTIIAPLCALLAITASQVLAQPHLGPTAREVVEFTRFVQPDNANDDELGDQVSPDGTQAFIVTRKADVASDANRYEIQLLDVTPAHLAAHRSPGPVIVFSASVARDDEPTDAGVEEVRWLDDHTLTLLARLDGGSRQVYSLDVPTRKLVRLTQEMNRIVSYAVSRDRRRVVCVVQVPNPPLREGEHGVVVGTRSFWSVKFGQNELRAQDRMYQYVVTESSRTSKALGEPFSVRNGASLVANISPDGRWAIVQHYKPERLAEWARMYPMLGDRAARYAMSTHIDPLQYFSTSVTVVPRTTTVWQLDDMKEQTIVDAPDDEERPQARRGERLWQGGGTSVVLAGTHLPTARDGKTPPASHIIEYWPERRRWIDIAALDGHMMEAHPIDGGFMVLDGTRRREFLRQSDGGWREAAAAAAARSAGAGWSLHVSQGLNQPPDVYASGPAGEQTRLTALNPQFDGATWGVMRPYAWKDGAGRQWDGGLMSESGNDAHTPRPLLIQTYGFLPDRFYLDGPNTSDAFSTGFAGRAFLREGMLVLAMPWAPEGGNPTPEHEAFVAFNEGVRGAIDALVREGRVDPARVGIIAFSATGERVLSLLTATDVPIRAATSADGDANTLWAYTVAYGAIDVLWGRVEKLNQGPPFGDGLSAWIRNDPAFHTDCIRTPLRIESNGFAVKPNWDIYALLRRQYKPVEMIAFPTGSHTLMGAGDRMGSLQGNVDWHAFWLMGKTRTTPLMPWETVESVAAQYARWRQLETLKAADDARPRCVR